MKRGILCASVILFLLLLPACGTSAAAPAVSTGAVPAAKTLRVEAAFPSVAEADALYALHALPDKLHSALQEAGAAVERVEMTVGTSPSATCAALSGGGIDVAFLPADALARFGGGTAIMVSGPAGQTLRLSDGTLTVVGGEPARGTQAILYAAPTEYGQNLSRRAHGGADLSREELHRARWGFPADGTLARRCAELWLEDRYVGDTSADLPTVTVYPNTASLLDAADDGEVDLFWLETDDPAAADAAHAALLEQSAPLALTERLFVCAAAAGPGFDTPAFAAALAQAVETVCAEDTRLTALLGSDGYAAVEDGALDPQRRSVAFSS